MDWRDQLLIPMRSIRRYYHQQGVPIFNPTLAPPSSFTPQYTGVTPGYPNAPLGGYPAYNGTSPVLPGAGQSATVGTFQNTVPGFTQPGVFPK